VRRPGKNHRAEDGRRQEHHLAIGQMRRDQPRYIGLRESWDRSSALSTAQRCLRLQVPVARRGGD
jgi:hypothetical protein